MSRKENLGNGVQGMRSLKSGLVGYGRIIDGYYPRAEANQKLGELEKRIKELLLNKITERIPYE